MSNLSGKNAALFMLDLPHGTQEPFGFSVWFRLRQMGRGSPMHCTA